MILNYYTLQERSEVKTSVDLIFFFLISGNQGDKFYFISKLVVDSLEGVSNLLNKIVEVS
jgi:hypothetical protein